MIPPHRTRPIHLLPGSLFISLVFAISACHVTRDAPLRPAAPDAGPEEMVGSAAPAEPVEAGPAAPSITDSRAFRRFRDWWQREPYDLDHLSRGAVRDERGKVECPDLGLERYAGDHVRYHKPVKVYPGFKARLARFEAIVARVATDIYGRAPEKIVHFGTYNCRTVRGRKGKLSEHALGNAIDVAEFRFAAPPKADRKALREAGQRELARAFRVNVEDHWFADGDFTSEHSRFLRRLVRELQDDRVFRGMIVPPARGHHNHMHLDMGRWSYLRGDATPPSLPADDAS